MSSLNQRIGRSGVAPGGQKDQNATVMSARFEVEHITARSAILSSFNDSKMLFIGVILSGIGVIFLLALLAVCCIQRRKKRQASKGKKGAQPMAYSGLNSAFAGVSFRDSQHSSISPRPLLLSHSNATYSGAPSPGQRPSDNDRFIYLSNRDGSSPQQSPQQSPQCWPPITLPHPYSSQNSRTHSHARPYSRTTHARMHSRTISREEDNSSPLTLNDPSEAHVLSGYGPYSTTELEATKVQEPQIQARDTMGFPVEQSAIFDEIRLQSMTPVLYSPKPKRLAHQESLERMVRAEILAPSPAPSKSAPGRDRVISQEDRESPVLGILSPVRIHHPTLTRLGSGLGRSDSHRTVASESTMGPIIGDEELESLGVGARPQPLRLRNNCS